MKKKLFFILAIFALFFSSCDTLAYLPRPKEIDLNEYGAYIVVRDIYGPNAAGELLAVDSLGLTILGEYDSKIITVPRAEIQGFTLRYARAPGYGWTIPTSILLSLTHGSLLILTLPINLITTIIVTAQGSSDYQYKDGEISYADLKMFARYPQGAQLPQIKVLWH